MSKHRIALVKNGMYTSGGVSSVCRFIFQTVSIRTDYDVHLISLDATYNNPINVRIFSPSSWTRGIGIQEYHWRNTLAKHVGSSLSELEFRRYIPRSILTDLLNQYDLVQVVAGSPALAYAARDVKSPVCIQAATTSALEYKSTTTQVGRFRKLYKAVMLPIVSEIEKRALRGADHIFADTAYTRQAFLPFADESKITIDVIGVDTTQFKPINRNRRTEDYILSVGRLADPRKNVGLLFKAYAQLRELVPTAPKLVLAGQTLPPPAVLENAKRLGIWDNIVIKHAVTFDELVGLYQNAAFFVLSSNEEGLGIVLLEAMACATPVVSTRCGGPDSVVSDNVGFLTPIGDAQAVADRMAWMLKNPEQRRIMGEAARQMVVNRFSNEVVGQKYLDVYDRLLGN